mmetsp:Transcript_5780/g.12731  ORF Transcript_5780/g.12731 Transcript_5780/m.12731 type:complete len:355 (-) Transcript_5780:197-1261(-)|eukprot:4864428-Pleurochrysis_carterae.AAC.3
MMLACSACILLYRASAFYIPARNANHAGARKSPASPTYSNHFLQDASPHVLLLHAELSDEMRSARSNIPAANQGQMCAAMPAEHIKCHLDHAQVRGTHAEMRLRNELPGLQLLLNVPRRASSCWPALRRSGDPCMLRNYDACEALIFTEGALLTPSRIDTLVDTAFKQGTAVVLLATVEGAAGKLLASLGDAAQYFALETTPSPLSTPSLYNLISRLSVIPEGFGGSDGFGMSPPQAERPPLASRCIVFVTSLAECAAVRAAGMRAVALPDSSGFVSSEVEGFADAIVNSLDEVELDDLSTPGAYWLNPAAPRDLSGNAVDPTTGLPSGISAVSDDDYDDELAMAEAILADLDQ